MSGGALTAGAAAEAADELWGRLAESAAAVGPDDWGRPTPCAAWDVHDLVAHVVGVGGMFYGLPQPDVPAGWAPPEGLAPLDALMEAGVAARRDASPEALLAELDAVRAAHVAALRALPDLSAEAVGPTGPTDQAGLFRVRCFDMWHHWWDLRTALGLPVDPVADTSDAAAACHAYVAGMAPWLLGKRAGAPEGSAVRLRLDDPLGWDRVVAVVDGRARWVDDATDGTDPDEGTAAVEGPPAAFSLVISGRLPPDEAAELGLRWSGEAAEALLGARIFG
jgi:uncharacterized protein (TIGR03083 family)